METALNYDEQQPRLWDLASENSRPALPHALFTIYCSALNTPRTFIVNFFLANPKPISWAEAKNFNSPFLLGILIEAHQIFDLPGEAMAANNAECPGGEAASPLPDLPHHASNDYFDELFDMDGYLNHEAPETAGHAVSYDANATASSPTLSGGDSFTTVNTADGGVSTAATSPASIAHPETSVAAAAVSSAKAGNRENITENAQAAMAAQPEPADDFGLGAALAAHFGNQGQLQSESGPEIQQVMYATTGDTQESSMGGEIPADGSFPACHSRLIQHN